MSDDKSPRIVVLGQVFPEARLEELRRALAQELVGVERLFMGDERVATWPAHVAPMRGEEVTIIMDDPPDAEGYGPSPLLDLVKPVKRLLALEDALGLHARDDLGPDATEPLRTPFERRTDTRKAERRGAAPWANDQPWKHKKKGR